MPRPKGMNNISLLEIIPVWIREIPDNLKTQEMCNEATRIEPYSLPFVPDCSKAQEMCDKAIQIDPFTLRHVPDNLKTQELCIRGVEAGPGLLEFVPDWFVTQQQIKISRDDDEYCGDDELIEWYNGYQKRKAQKAKTKEELLPITWYPDHVMEWYMSEDEKRLWK